MNLADYLKRIDYAGPLTPDLETLNALHEAHVRAVPFENFDIHAGRSVGYALEAAYDQIVERRQGGWCYEMNTLFGWALSEIGFEVTRLCAGVRREKLGDAALGNHLALMVTLDRDCLVDVGFSGTQLKAIALEPAVTRHPPYLIALDELGDGYWRLFEGGPGAMMNFDFRAEPGDEALLAQRHDEQISDPNCIFRKTLIAKIRRGRTYLDLRGLMLETHFPGRKERRLIGDQAELARVLEEMFGLVEPELERLWPVMLARHRQLFPHTARQQEI